jgi:hypothetical protein
MVVFLEKVGEDSKEVVEKVGEAKKVEFWEMEEEEQKEEEDERVERMVVFLEKAGEE